MNEAQTRIKTFNSKYCLCVFIWIYEATFRKFRPQDGARSLLEVVRWGFQEILSIGQPTIILGGQLASVTRNAALRQTVFDKPFSGRQFAHWLQFEKKTKKILLESVFQRATRKLNWQPKDAFLTRISELVNDTEQQQLFSTEANWSVDYQHHCSLFVCEWGCVRVRVCVCVCTPSWAKIKLASFQGTTSFCGVEIFDLNRFFQSIWERRSDHRLLECRFGPRRMIQVQLQSVRWLGWES